MEERWKNSRNENNGFSQKNTRLESILNSKKREEKKRKVQRYSEREKKKKETCFKLSKSIFRLKPIVSLETGR